MRAGILFIHISLLLTVFPTLQIFKYHLHCGRNSPYILICQLNILFLLSTSKKDKNAQNINSLLSTAAFPLLALISKQFYFNIYGLIFSSSLNLEKIFLISFTVFHLIACSARQYSHLFLLYVSEPSVGFSTYF